MTKRELVRLIGEAISCNTCTVIGHHNLHSLYLYHHDAEMRRFYERADCVYIDGMSLVLIGRLLGKRLRREQRSTLLDWLHPLLREAAANGWRVFFLGATYEVGQQALAVCRAEFPQLQMETAPGFFDARPGSRESQCVRSAINTYRPHLLLVGMGMPRQERWIVHESPVLEANVIIACGATMDYIAGVVSTPPRWLGRFGLEWSYRLLMEPKRLWRRYLIEPWFALRLLVREWVVR
jgi:N-acetylglucosaminyldiphosphoundecaprenol N-acetyl-beta-D-mannosaminyltransferase